MKIAVVALFLSAICVFGSTTTGQNQTQRTAFVRVDRIGEATARSFFIFSTSQRNYAIRHDGHGEGSSPPTVLRKNFDLKMRGAVRLEQVFYAEYEGDLLLEYEVTDLKTNWGYLLRMDQRTMKIRWITSLNGKSFEPGLIVGRSVSIYASDLVFRIDLNTGTDSE